MALTYYISNHHFGNELPSDSLGDENDHGTAQAVRYVEENTMTPALAPLRY